MLDILDAIFGFFSWAGGGGDRRRSVRFRVVRAVVVVAALGAALAQFLDSGDAGPAVAMFVIVLVGLTVAIVTMWLLARGVRGCFGYARWLLTGRRPVTPAEQRFINLHGDGPSGVG